MQTLRWKIAAGYIAALSIAVVGTATGLLVGQHYQRQAAAARDASAREHELLNRLQLKILYNRPAKQLGPHLQDPAALQQASEALRARLARIEAILTDYRQLASDTTQPELRARLADYEPVVADFTQALAEFSTTAMPLAAQQSPAAEELLLDLAQSPEFIDFIEFPNQLLGFAERAEQQAQAAERALLQAERFRTQMAVGSLGDL